jgi:hypothetical protein
VGSLTEDFQFPVSRGSSYLFVRDIDSGVVDVHLHVHVGHDEAVLGDVDRRAGGAGEVVGNRHVGEVAVGPLAGHTQHRGYYYATSPRVVVKDVAECRAVKSATFRIR